MCSSCKAVMWHTEKTFTAKHPSSRKWKEWEVEEAISGTVCKKDTFEGYGVKLINGKNVLGGPALKEQEKELEGGQASRIIIKKLS